jgi:hypothetical protein
MTREQMNKNGNKWTECAEEHQDKTQADTAASLKERHKSYVINRVIVIPVEKPDRSTRKDAGMHRQVEPE